MKLIYPFSFASVLPRSLRAVTLKSLHSNSRSLLTATVVSSKATYCTFPAEKSYKNNHHINNASTNALSSTRTLSSSSSIDAAPLHLAEFKQPADAINLKFEKLKELSYFVVQRSPTRHFSQVCRSISMLYNLFFLIFKIFVETI